MADWIALLSLTLSAAALLLWALTYLNQRRLRVATESRNALDRLEGQIRMYQDIARGNKWNWRPNEGYSHAEYPQFVAWVQRCIGYDPLVDDSMRPEYSKWVGFLTGRPPSGLDYDSAYKSVIERAEAKVAELRKRLSL